MIELNLTQNATFFQRTCIIPEGVDTECLQKMICPQLKHYYVNTGIILIIVTIVQQWLTWWYFNHGYKHIDFSNKYIGDLTELETRIYWDTQIKHWNTLALMMFVTIVVYLNI